jgi:hypothetical protein
MGYVRVINEPTRLKISETGTDVRYEDKLGLTAEADDEQLVLRRNGAEVLREYFYNFLEPRYNVDHHSVKELVCIISDWIGIFPTDGVDKHFTFIQGVASATWIVNHNLDKKPSVTVVDTGDNEVWGCVQHIDENNLIITFSAAFTGKAYLN